MMYRQLKKEEARVGLNVQFISDIQCEATIISINETGLYPYLVQLKDGEVDGAKLEWLNLIVEK